MGLDRSFQNILLGFIILLCILSGCLTAGVIPQDNTSVILLLHSYHPTYQWSEDITDGFLDTIEQTEPRDRIAIEYLDWKHYPSNASLRLQEELLRYKYGNKKIKLVVVVDDTALQFVLDRRETLFRDVPVVFTGLNGYENLHPYTYRNVTGIVSAINPEATLKAMVTMFPDTRDIWIICEDTESGREINRLIRQAARRISQNIVYHDIGNITTDEVYRKMSDLPPHSLIIIGNWSRDSQGTVVDISQFAEILARVSPVPVFNLYNFNNGNGTIGGNILSDRHQGVLAGEMAIKILTGTATDTIPINLNDSTSYVFDAQVLQRFNVPTSKIPLGSTLIHQEPDILDLYFREVIAGFITIIILVSSILGLLYFMHQRKKMERLMTIFMNTLPGIAFFKDTEGRYQIGNQEFLKTIRLGYPEFIGKTDEEIYPVDLAKAYRRDDQTVISSKAPLYIPEEDIEVRPGRRVPYTTRKVPVTGDYGEVIGVIGLSVDISEQKAARQELEESRQKYYTLFELGREAIFLVEDSTGKILEANSAASDMYGYSHKELLSMKYYELYPGLEKISKSNHVLGEYFSIPITSHIKKDKTVFPVEIVGRYFEWKEKQVFVAAVRDSTERTRDQEALKKATEKINLFNYLTRITMNNQLFILRGYLDFAMEAVNNEEAVQYLKRSRNAVQSIDRLVLFMKNYQDLGLKPAIWQRVDEVFIYAISHLNMEGIERKITGEPLQIYADTFLEKVFQHLVENSQVHGNHVTQVGIRIERDGEDLLLIYEDDGAGIPPEDKDQIFSHNLEGKTGIGLILVREILAITGISITEEGELGRGARFIMRIPKGGFRFGETD